MLFILLVAKRPTIDTPEDDVVSVEDPDNVTTTIGTRVTILESSNVTLSCHANGYPTPTVTWLLNGNPLASQGHITVDDSTRSLTLRNVKPDAGGEYSCTATNALGSDTLNTTLSIIGRFFNTFGVFFLT